MTRNEVRPRRGEKNVRSCRMIQGVLRVDNACRAVCHHHHRQHPQQQQQHLSHHYRCRLLSSSFPNDSVARGSTVSCRCRLRSALASTPVSTCVNTNTPGHATGARRDARYFNADLSAACTLLLLLTPGL